MESLSSTVPSSGEGANYMQWYVQFHFHSELSEKKTRVKRDVKIKEHHLDHSQLLVCFLFMCLIDKMSFTKVPPLTFLIVD